MTALTYFAYGSNMSQPRLTARAPSAQRIGAATLRDHVLACHKISTNDGSGKCDIVACRGSVVLGVLFRIDRSDKRALDHIEGVGTGYREAAVRVLDTRGRPVDAFTYFATLTDPAMKPFTWYRRHVVEGARQARLPTEYIARIEAWPAVEDPDIQRARLELAVYREKP